MLILGLDAFSFLFFPFFFLVAFFKMPFSLPKIKFEREVYLYTVNARFCVDGSKIIRCRLYTCIPFI